MTRGQLSIRRSVDPDLPMIHPFRPATCWHDPYRRLHLLVTRRRLGVAYTRVHSYYMVSNRGRRDQLDSGRSINIIGRGRTTGTRIKINQDANKQSNSWPAGQLSITLDGSLTHERSATINPPCNKNKTVYQELYGQMSQMKNSKNWIIEIFHLISDQ